ncbi:tetratricopeptide repeat protein [Streptosporangium pseudovulgare]|uniref:Tetratricopeptide repeat protein n=1 Tax=Streptosporangium pseudovulgare TaxID=35765 RepID=A0ABQ2QK95_9ACTN|nr:tetratricopeptide repeat protein [Streptosporangium pseudovulgare]GGP84374.1 hypothetical protein GCM10010140_11830 [Streptosporangium pseudovulgare]
MQAASADDPDRARFLAHLADTLQLWSRETEEPAYLEEAIPFWEQALEIFPADHPDRAAYLSNLGVALEMRYDLAGASADREEAIAVRAQAAQTAGDTRENDL